MCIIPQMSKPGIKIEIPGHGALDLRYMVTDYTGTLSYRGELVPGVYDQLRELGEKPRPRFRLRLLCVHATTRGQN